MTATAEPTQSPIQAVQERMEAALAEMQRLGQELQALPAQEQEALRRGDEEAALRIPVRRRILERQGHEANIARALAAYQVAQAQAAAERARERELSQALQDAFTRQEAAQLALEEAQRARGQAQGNMVVHQRRLEDLHRAEREAEQAYRALKGGQ